MFTLLFISILLCSVRCPGQSLSHDSKQQNDKDAENRTSTSSYSYSSYHCVGKDDPVVCTSIGCNYKDHPSVRSCVFRKVCLEHKTQEWLFFTDGDSSELPLQTLSAAPVEGGAGLLKLYPAIFPPNFYVSLVTKSDFGVGDDLTRYTYFIYYFYFVLVLPLDVIDTWLLRSNS